MSQLLGKVAALYRYPVKSMIGETLDEAQIGWHGVDGDRRYAFLREGDPSGFPWLTAGRLDMLLKHAVEREGEHVFVRTPAGARYGIHDPALAAELSAAFGKPVRAVHLGSGVFDEAPISLMSQQSLESLGDAVGMPPLDPRRFRPNVLIDAHSGGYPEDQWVGRSISIGAARIRVALRDVRCGMVNMDPDTLERTPAVLKTIAAQRETCLGVYAYVEQPGLIRAGDPIMFY
jgi:uncharacterized protein